MAVNKYKPHVLVLPEDRANSRIANGFLLEPALKLRNIQILPEVGGWLPVLQCFKCDHVADMERFPHRHIILLIDFDNADDRLTKAREFIPPNLHDRVFVIGMLSEPEAFPLRPFEQIGEKLATDCSIGSRETWNHELLQHNDSEVRRLSEKVHGILFGND